MATNSIPENRGLLSGLGVKMLAGLNSLGSSLGITQITPKSFGALLDAFNAALNGYNTERSGRQSAYDLFHSAVNSLSNWLRVVRNVLMGPFGDHWNTMWAQAGFVQPSVAIPRRLQDRITLALKLAQFFTDNPTYEVESMDVTAAKGTSLRGAVIKAQNPLQTATVDLKTAQGVLNTSQQALVDNMRFLIKILSGTLEKDDPRWEAFGLNIPATDTTPAAPTGLRATITGSQVLLECDATPLATRYRFRTRIVGIEDDYRLAASSVTPMAMLESVAAGNALEVIAQAVNGPSQSVASDSITVEMPVATAPLAEAKPALSLDVAPLAAVAPSNGNGNGSYAVSRT